MIVFGESWPPPVTSNLVNGKDNLFVILYLDFWKMVFKMILKKQENQDKYDIGTIQKILEKNTYLGWNTLMFTKVFVIFLISLIPHNKSAEKMLSLFYRWGNWSSQFNIILLILFSISFLVLSYHIFLVEWHFNSFEFDSG